MYVGTLAASLPLTLPREVLRSDITIPSDQVFEVAVVANGVPPDGKFYKPTQDQERKVVGLDLWIGADTAWKQLKASSDKVPFKLDPQDDRNDDTAAREISEKIRSDPRIIAVIGHGITSTTHAAVDAYSAAQIPLLVAWPTGEKALLGDQGIHRARIAFRLSASDSTGQAPAIAYFIKNNLVQDSTGQKRQVHLLVSDADNADDYAGPLCDRVNEILADDKVPVSTETTKVDPINATVDEIKEQHEPNDFVVYCGYSAKAKELLNSLSSLPPAQLPKIIVSSGVDLKTIQAFPTLPIYRMHALERSSCSDKETVGEIEKIAKDTGRELTPAQIRGYEAVQVLATAAKRCSSSNELSRDCIREQLESGEGFAGVCSEYWFRDGENIVSNFFVDTPKTSAAAGSHIPTTPDIITASDILKMLPNSNGSQ